MAAASNPAERGLASVTGTDARCGAPGPDVVLFASYGTTRGGQRSAALEPVADALAAAFPGVQAAWAYTSAKVRRALAARGEPVPGVDAALAALAEAGARRVLVQPGHVVAGAAFSLVEDAAAAACAQGAFERLELGAPLLAGMDDVRAVAGVLDGRYAPRPGAAVLLAGHGADASAGLPYAALGCELHIRGRADVLVACMHGYPDLPSVLALLERRALADATFARERRVVLVPFMLTAGAHAQQDLAGAGAGSWKSQLERAGYVVEPQLTGLGALPGIQRLYVAHARAAWRQKGRLHPGQEQKPIIGA